MVATRTNGIQRLYLDGTLDAGPTANTVSFDNSRPLGIGARASGGGPYA